MTEERSERIRELEQRITLWERERTHEVQEGRDFQKNLRETLRLALHVVCIGSIPSVVWLICWAAVTGAGDSWFGQTFLTITSLFVYAIVAAGAARGSGLLAHWWFYRSDVQQRVATISIALSADLFMFWWVMVLTPW